MEKLLVTQDYIFDELEDRLQYTQWYFGHYHQDGVIDEKHTLLYNAIVPFDYYILEKYT